MSAKVEIIVNELEDVTFIPVQSVFVENGEHIVFLKTVGGYRRQLVETGAFNNDFIELKSGVEEGDKVFLRMPTGYEPPKVEKARILTDNQEQVEDVNSSRSAASAGNIGAEKSKDGV